VRTAAYFRVSSEEQAERGSIENQRIAFDGYRAIHPLGQVEVYADDGVTGTLALDARPEGGRMMQDARAGRINRIVITKLDRLGRSAVAILNAVSEMESLGVELVSITEQIDTSTPAGRFLLTILSGVAALERDMIVARSADGTNRLARAGAWLGGIVPFGYVVEGRKNLSRLAVADDVIPEVGLSEADVIRMIYRMAGDEGLSTIAIAHTLNALGIPTRYTRDGREVERGKRKQATANHWSPGRVRNMLVSSTYRGVHEYGKRSKRERELIVRDVPAIVDAALWQRAQDTLSKNARFAKRNRRREYLLRGLMKCGCCGLTYIGNANKGAGGQERLYYKCNGKHSRGRQLPYSHACPSKSIPALEIETAIWKDVEHFLRNPGAVLAQLSEQLQADRESTAELGDHAGRLERALKEKSGERDAVLALYRRGRIDDAALDRQLDDIEAEEKAVRQQLEAVCARIEAAGSEAVQLASAEALLRSLNGRLDGTLDAATRRQLVETLIDRINVQTDTESGTVSIVAHYRFAAVDTRTGTGSWRRPA
jgi:site-specific DNA recombinase